MDHQSGIIKMSAAGDDRNLAEHGNDKHYWYSVRDVMTLLINVRKKSLTYHNRPVTVVPGEEYSALRENDQGAFVADPQHSTNFNNYLSNDIDKITGIEEIQSNIWKHMPTQIVIPLLSGLHWRVIRIQISYSKKTISILWDDPYGSGAFPEQLKNELRESIISNVNKLITKETNTKGFVLTGASITEITKVIEQQQKGENSWDCGPIAVSNIRDYVINLVTENVYFSQYSIPSFIDSIDYEEKLVRARKEHIIQYSELSGIPIDIYRFEDIKNSASSSLNLSAANLGKYQTQISDLSSFKIDMLFAILDNHRQAVNNVSDELYSDNEIDYALEFINRPLSPRRLSGSFDNKNMDLDSDHLNKILEQKKGHLQQLSFATDTEDFPEVINNNIEFVDKSLFIKEIIQSTDKVSIITRPRRWGKTTNIEMLKTFLSITLDDRGELIAISPNKSLFDDLLIGQESEIVSIHQGKYPVIFISFKNVKTSTKDKKSSEYENYYQAVEDLLKIEIKKLFRQYDYLQDSTMLKEYYKKDFDKYLEGDISRAEIGNSVQFLSELLYKHHKEKVYILVDEYDTPLNYAYQNPDYERVLGVMRAILGTALKGNQYLKKSVVTGITKIAKAGLFSDINNVGDYSILHPRYAQYFGFTEKEVENLLSKAHIDDESIRKAIKEYYNGYYIGDFVIYNPWSIASFFRDMRIESYWVNTESMVLGDRRLSTDLLITDIMQEQVKQLISNCKGSNQQFIDITINPEVVFTNLKSDPVAAWTLLAYSGYLSLTNRKKNYGSTITYQAKIPNKEVLDIYEDSIALWIREKLNLDDKGINIDEVLKNFDLENIDQVKVITQQIISQHGDRMAQENESIFHSLIEVICLLGGKNHILSAEKKSGTGRIDSIFYPIIDKSNKVIIHEYKILKKSNKEEDINAKIQEALWQVYERNYLEEVMTKFHNFDYSYYQSIEVRAIIILIDENNRNFGMKVDTISHSIADSYKILEFFKTTPEKQLVKLKDKISAQEVIEIIRDTSSPNETIEKFKSEKLINFDATNDIADDIVSNLGKAIHNNKLAKKLIEDYGSSLFAKSEQELRNIDDVGRKRAHDIFEICEQYKKAKADIVMHNQQDISAQNDMHMDITVAAVLEIKYDNPILNHPNFVEILKITKEKAGTIAITELLNQDYKSVKLLEFRNTEEIAAHVIRQNFFLNNEKGRDFIQVVASNFDEKGLLTILELGRDQDIAEQILTEIETQSINKVVHTLIGKELPATGSTDNLENIIGKDELNQLRIVPNGILNNWSNKAYYKVVDYINSLAKTLDDMLNLDKSGNQAAITIALLEEWLGFAASGQRFVGGVPPYYDPNSDDDWSNGGDSNNNGNNNSSNPNGFTGLILPLHNGTDYNITDYQM